jgi:hypothetical protein
MPLGSPIGSLHSMPALHYVLTGAQKLLQLLFKQRITYVCLPCASVWLAGGRKLQHCCRCTVHGAQARPPLCPLDVGARSPTYVQVS